VKPSNEASSRWNSEQIVRAAGMLKAQTDSAAQTRQLGRSESLHIQALGDSVDIASLYVRGCDDDDEC
jgi:hypothetical protein